MNKSISDITLPLEILCDSPEAFSASTLRGQTRDGDPYSGFSVCHYTGDDPAHIELCRRVLCNRLGIGEEFLVIPRQTHSVNALWIGKESTLPVNENLLQEVDAIVTDRTDIVIGVNTADCVPIVLVDSGNLTGAVVHAGWRGALAGIVQSALDEMVIHGADLARTRAWIGPCIRREDFEVGEEVATLFPPEFVESRPGFKKPHVDLPGYVARILYDKGICNVYLPQASTLSHPERYFSARVHGVSSGRIFTFLKLHKR